MTQLGNERALRLVRETLEHTRDDERNALLAWLTSLREIRDSQATAIAKGQAALRISVNAQVVRTLVNTLAPEVKQAAAATKKALWDDRSWAARFGLAGVTLGAVAFGSEAAGLAALGSAVGVPLWLVIGAGGSFLGAMIEELERANRPR